VAGVNPKGPKGSEREGGTAVTAELGVEALLEGEFTLGPIINTNEKNHVGQRKEGTEGMAPERTERERPRIKEVTERLLSELNHVKERTGAPE